MTTWPAGLLSALVTPLSDDQLDVDSLARLVEFQIENGARGLVVGGGTGEFGALSIDERARLAAEVVRLSAGRLPVIVQTGALATRDALTLGKHASDSGADGLLVASPFGEPISWNERFHFYQDIASSAELPVMIYNTPPAGLLDIDQVDQLAQLPNVSAIKDSSGDPAFLGDILAAYPSEELAVYVGADSLLYDAVAAGAHGAVFGCASFIPGLLSRLTDDLHASGPTDDSAAAWGHLRPFLRFIETSSNYVALCKLGCGLVGVDVGVVRAPYLMPESDEIDRFIAQFEVLTSAFSNPSRTEQDHHHEQSKRRPR